MVRPGNLGLGLHGGPESRVRTIVVDDEVPAPPTDPPPSKLDSKSKPAPPTTRSRKTAPSEVPVPPKSRRVVTLKVKSPMLKYILGKRATPVKK